MPAMNGFLRILCNVATALSAVLCMASAVLWARSYSGDEFWMLRRAPQRDWVLQIARPDTADLAAGLNVVPDTFQGFSHIRTPHDYIAMTRADDPQISMLGVGIGRTSAMQWIRMPLSLMTLLFGAAPFLRLRTYRRKRRRLPGHCRKCGYDLRATPDRCPECGAAPTAQDVKRGQQYDHGLIPQKTCP
jgi:hypothetical protein